MARRRADIDDMVGYLPASLPTQISPAPTPGASAYDNLVDESKIGPNSDQVSSGEAPLTLTFLLMGC